MVTNVYTNIAQMSEFTGSQFNELVREGALSGTLTTPDENLTVGESVQLELNSQTLTGTYIGYITAGDESEAPIVESNGNYYALTSSYINGVPATLVKADDSLCFLAGTRILTPEGEVPVEDLQIGDRVVTRFSGFQIIKWIGRQTFDARFVRRNRQKIPVRIQAQALGDTLPARDLFVSPGHAMLIGSDLVLAKNLVNGVTITQNWGSEQICYLHLELEHHDCVIAEGTWAETYADTAGMRGQFHNASTFHALYPDQPVPDEPSLCAPRPERGPALDAALGPVVARAAAGLLPGPLEGYTDLVTEQVVEGWAMDVLHPDLPVLMEVVLDGQVLGTALACHYRPDLEAAKKGRGHCAFGFTLPEALPAEALARIYLRRAADGAVLARTAAQPAEESHQAA